MLLQPLPRPRRNRAVRALIGLRAGAERVGGSVCAADVAEWRNCDTQVRETRFPKLRVAGSIPVVRSR
jgi:hypothetical protein